MEKNDKCLACDLPWEEHLGIISICQNYQTVLSALNVLYSQAKFKDTRFLAAQDTLDLINKAFKKIGYKPPVD